MQIVAVETIRVALPTRRKHQWTGLTEPIGGYVLVKMTGSDGTVGWGEAPALKDWGGDYGRYYGETAGTVEHVVGRYLAPAVRDVPADNFIGLHLAMDAMIKGFPYAKAAVEMAAYDLVGRARGMPVHLLLGGKARARVPVTHSIGLIELDVAVEECRTVAGQGIRTIKLKVGVEPERDVELVRRVREAVGPEVDLCVDANGGYRTPGEAIQIVRRMEPYGLKYVEQPVHGLDRVAQVARAIDAPVMADESAWNKRDALAATRTEAIDIVSIYTTKPGGLYRAMEVAAVASAASIICNVNGSVETGVGNLANVQLAAAAAPVELSCVVPVSTPAEAQREGQIAGIYYTDDLIANPMRFEDGCIVVPDGPGMGIEIDEDKVEKYRAPSALA
jgi:muconate cycloisomerase